MAIGKWLRLRVNSDKQVRESSIVLVSVLRASAYFTLQLQNSNSSCSKGGCWGGGSAIAFLRQRACAGLRRGRLACQRPRSQSGRASPALTLEMLGMAGFGRRTAPRGYATNDLGQDAQAK